MIQVAEQLTSRDRVAAHAKARHGLDPHDLTNPWHAVIAYVVAIGIGAVVPLTDVVIGSPAWITAALAAIALVTTETVSAQRGRAPIGRTLACNAGGGLVAMAITFGLGNLAGTFI